MKLSVFASVVVTLKFRADSSVDGRAFLKEVPRLEPEYAHQEGQTAVTSL